MKNQEINKNKFDSSTGQDPVAFSHRFYKTTCTDMYNWLFDLYKKCYEIGGSN